MAFLGGIYAAVPVTAVFSKPQRLYSLYKHGSSAAATYYQITSLLPALGSGKKLGIRAGTEPTTKPLGEFPPYITSQYGPEYMDRMPMLYPDVGIMAVPNDSSRWLWESKKKSTRVEHTSRSGTTITRKSMRGGSALESRDKTTWAGRKRTRSRPSSKRKSGHSSAPQSGQYIRPWSHSFWESGRMTKPSGERSGRRRTPTSLRYRRGGCPPGYRYDPRRKMCVRTY